MSSGSLVFSASSSPCGIENGLCEKSTWLDSSLNSNIGKSTIQQKSNRSLSTRLSSVPMLGAREAGELVEGLGIAGDEEGRVADLEAELGADRLGAFRAEVARDRPGAALLAFPPEDVAEARLALALRPGVHPVAERARAAARRRDRPDGVLGLLQHPREDAEAAAAEVLGDVLHHQRVAQVGLVGAVLGDRLAVGDARERIGRHRLAVGELLEQAVHDRLHGGEHVLLGGEAHLEVELVELARRAVGPGVLVAEAGRDLEVAVEAGHHQQLLELLRRLRQRIELARMHARRHQVVARALRRRGGQDRGLELGEARARPSAAGSNRSPSSAARCCGAGSRAAGRDSGTSAGSPPDSPARRTPAAAARRPPTAPRRRESAPRSRRSAGSG